MYMKNVVIFDSFKRVFNEDNTLLHDAVCSEVIKQTNLSKEDACKWVNTYFEETKKLGDYTEVVSQPNLGVVEIKVEFSDKRQLHRVIYLKDSK